MKVWFDTEFIEDGRTIDLISIGVVCEDGIAYYAESAECDLSKASPWVKENVIPKLTGNRIPRKQIASEVVRIVGSKPEFWAYYADYDWVALCQLYGTMMQLPATWPMFCMDVKQLLMSVGNPRIGTNDHTPKVHNALTDAEWARAAWALATARLPDNVEAK